jgi:bifunctional non-homologous end joining protein LigD
VVVIHDGRTNFSELQAELASSKQDRLIYYAFDLLWRDGDLRKLPQIERKQILSDLLGENDIGLPVIYSEHLTGDGQEMFEHAAKLNFEGIVSKRADAPYRSERTEAWLKIKTVQKGKFPVIGFERPDWRGRAVPGQARRQRPSLHGQGRHRLVADSL